MLENASETVRLDEAPVRISGLEIPLRAYARFGKKDLPLKRSQTVSENTARNIRSCLHIIPDIYRNIWNMEQI